jgi:Cellulase (glycosyl hydrolase family 5)
MMHVLRPIRLALVACAFLALSAPVANAAPRMLMGFQDDPSFRWADDSQLLLDRAAGTGVSMIRTTADWRAIAPTRPSRATDSFDPAYKFGDLDDMVRRAQQRGVETLITIWGTPKWANGGKTPNIAPRNVNDLRNFARAIADRYSGRHPGYPYVARWSVWNEPNLDLFLKPQYDRKGRIVGPALYAKLYAAAYAGIKAGNARAQVAIGETSARGRDHKSGGSGSVSPGKFAELVAKANPRLKFAAWAQHPYPTEPSMKPLQKVKWPNVTLPSLARFEVSLDKWFHRRGIPIWITEYGHETKPAEPRGVSFAQQSAYTRQAVLFAQKDKRVQMFIWFIFRDSPTSAWQSGFFSENDVAKPALATWRLRSTRSRGRPSASPTASSSGASWWPSASRRRRSASTRRSRSPSPSPRRRGRRTRSSWTRRTRTATARPRRSRWSPRKTRQSRQARWDRLRPALPSRSGARAGEARGQREGARRGDHSRADEDASPADVERRGGEHRPGGHDRAAEQRGEDARVARDETPLGADAAGLERAVAELRDEEQGRGDEQHAVIDRVPVPDERERVAGPEECDGDGNERREAEREARGEREQRGHAEQLRARRVAVGEPRRGEHDRRSEDERRPGEGDADQCRARRLNSRTSSSAA